MQKLFYILCFAFLQSLSSFGREACNVNITVDIDTHANKNVKFYFRYELSDNIFKLDSMIFDNDKQKQNIVKLNISENCLCRITNSLNKQTKYFIVEKGNIILVGDVNEIYNLRVYNSQEDSLYNTFNNQSLIISKQYRQCLKENNILPKDTSSACYHAYIKRNDSLIKSFVINNAEKTVSALVIYNSYVNNPNREQALVMYGLLSKTTQRGIYAVKIKKFLDANHRIGIGKIAPDFSLSNLYGKQIKLSDYKGKYVFIDFWASWCVPCRKETPLIKKLFHLNADKNIVFISISMDANMQSWKNAFERDGMDWIQLNDPLSMNGITAEKYGVKSIPFNVVVNPEGYIVGKQIHGCDMIAFFKNL